MATILCYKTALQALRLISGELPAPCPSKETKRVSSERPHPTPPATHSLIDFSLIDAPFQLVNNSTCRLPNTQERELHRWKTFPPGSLLHLGEGLYIPSPELLFVQIAAVVPLTTLISIGFELCGIYPNPKSDSFNLLKQTPFTTTRKLTTFIERNPGLRGVIQARRALPHIANGSASPMETAVYMRLALPCNLGGYGLPRPQLNHTISFSAKEAEICKRGMVICDLYWPNFKLAVEYDSDLHTGSTKIAKDAARRNALLLKGIKVVTITKNQMYSADEFDKAARVVARELNARIRPQCKNYERRKADLVRILLQGRMLNANALTKPQQLFG